MADGVVLVAQAAGGDRPIDNEALTVAGQTVYRQRVVTYPTFEETRLDYDVRTDGNPVYVGKAAQGTATAAATWTIQKLTYDTSSRLTRAEVLTGVAWNSRASLAW
jgi:YD repeat-containing protein